jgi:hypothetical protein
MGCIHAVGPLKHTRLAHTIACADTWGPLGSRTLAHVPYPFSLVHGPARLLPPVAPHSLACGPGLSAPPSTTTPTMAGSRVNSGQPC